MAYRRLTTAQASMIGGLMVLSAVALLGASAYFYFQTRNFLRTADKAEATVVKLIESAGGSNSHSVFYPVFKFTDSRGKEHQLNFGYGSYPPAYKVGDKILLLYDANDPTEAEPDTFWAVWFWPVLLFGMGVFDLAFASLLLLITMFLRRQEA